MDEITRHTKPAAPPVQQHERRLHSDQWKGLTAMELNSIEQSELTQSQRDDLAQGTALARRMGAGAHLDEWLSFGPRFLILRQLAMKITHVNKPSGRGYNEAFASLVKHHEYHLLDKQSVSAVLWIYDDPERERILRDIRNAMSPGMRSRLNSPISARARVQQVVDARIAGGKAEEKVHTSPVALLKKQLADASREIAELKAKLARSDIGSLFDLKQDSAKDIARVIVENISDHKAGDIEDEIKKLRKTRKQKPAG
jgi:hypothetical protein